MHFPGKCILTSMQSAGEKHRRIIFIFFLNLALRKTMVHSLKPWILSPIYTVTSLAKGKGLPSECELQLYLQPRTASGPYSKCEFSSSQLSVILSAPTVPGSFMAWLTALPMCLVKLAGQNPSPHLLCTDVKDTTMLFPKRSGLLQSSWL